MIPLPIRQALFFEIHRSIEEAANACVAGMLSPDEFTLGYPPNGELTPADRAALRKLAVSPEARAALEKLVVDACGYPFFHLFAVMDGVTEPETDVGEWSGVTLETKREDDEDMLHDEFLESCWNYEDRR
jgi:elongation factor P hydroxylase